MYLNCACVLCVFWGGLVGCNHWSQTHTISLHIIHTDTHVHKQIDSNAKPLGYYMKIQELQGTQDRYVIDQTATKLILPVLAHWASPAPETRTVPVVLMDTISQIIATKKIDSVQNNKISTHSEALRLLVLYDSQGSACVSVGATRELTNHLTDLLRLMLCVAKRGMTGAETGEKRHQKTAPWPPESPELGLDDDINTPELRSSRWCDIMRLASYFPHNPPFRRLQHCRADWLNEQASKRRKDKKTEEEKQAASELKKESERKGFTCNKYKEKTSQLTSGVFTCFCMGCNVCVGFEMMYNSGECD